MPSTKLTGSSTQNNPKQKTALEKAEEFPVRLQGAFALYKAMQMIEDDKENMTEEEYADSNGSHRSDCYQPCTLYPRGLEWNPSNTR